MPSRAIETDQMPLDPTMDTKDGEEPRLTEDELTDKLDRLAGGRTLSETAPLIPRGARGARAAAMQALYEEDLTGHPAIRALHKLPAFLKLSPAHKALAEALVGHVSGNREALDVEIADVAKEFPVHQLGAVDRNVLRIALAEMSEEINTPKAVAVNEAVEIAKLFGGDSSPRFVNGVLGALLR